MMVIPCLCLSRFSSCTATTKKVPRPKGLAASFLIDIPTHWEPRTNQSPTGALIAFAALGTCCSSPVPPTKTKRPDSNESGCFGGELGTRTPDPLRVMQVL